MHIQFNYYVHLLRYGQNKGQLEKPNSITNYFYQSIVSCHQSIQESKMPPTVPSNISQTKAILDMKDKVTGNNLNNFILH